MKIDFAGIFNKKNKTFIIVGISILVLLILFSELLPQGTKKSSALNYLPDENKYISELKTEITEFISKIDGAGKTEVYISFESGFETVYAEKNSQSSSDLDDKSGDSAKKENSSEYEYDYLTIRSDAGNESPVLLKVKYPKISGIVVACEGGGNTAIKEEITNALRAAFSLPSNKINVNKLRRN